MMDSSEKSWKLSKFDKIIDNIVKLKKKFEYRFDERS